MIGCQMNSLDGCLPSQLQHHIQATNVGVVHQSVTPITPISPVFGGTIYSQQDQYQQQQIQSPQLSRSKSLNDISNDSQIPAFASDRFINLQQNQDGNSGAINENTFISNNSAFCGGDNTQRHNLDQQHFQAIEHIPQSHQPEAGNLTQANSAQFRMPMASTYNVFSNSHQQEQAILRNFDDFQGSNTINNFDKPFGVAQSSNATVNTAMFDLCNPMVVNLNGVTEQIGNLHL